MIIALDSSAMTCTITLIHDDERYEEVWDAGRQLGDQLIGHLRGLLAERQKTWGDVTGLIVMRGPGSFTGLRIGMTVMNTMADTLAIPIVGQDGPDWINQGVDRLKEGRNDQLVIPVYGREANITVPRK